MKNYKSVCFFDLDGTLLNAQSQLDDEVIKAIGQLKENGSLPLIATGRSWGEIQGIMRQAGIDSAITMNGQMLHVNGKMIHENIFSVELVERVLNLAVNLGHSICFYNDSNIWSYKQTEIMQASYDHIHTPIPPENPDVYKQEKINMLLTLTNEIEKDNIYHETFPELTFYRNSPNSIDIVSAGISKGSGVKYILDYLDHSDLPTYAFGDGANDIPLLKAVTHGVAMENGVAETKAVAEYVTGKNTDGGLVQGLKYFGLI